jgi:hypothetical protein
MINEWLVLTVAALLMEIEVLPSERPPLCGKVGQEYSQNLGYTCGYNGKETPWEFIDSSGVRAAGDRTMQPTLRWLGDGEWRDGVKDSEMPTKHV